MIDFHCHVLPEMDDGADCLETSLAMMRKSRELGIETVIATPHYYGTPDLDQFLSFRQQAYHALQQAIEGEKLPELRLGCEVHLTKQIPEMDGLERLCIEGTNCILLEMPYDLWQPWLNDAVYYIIAVRNLIPVIAHVDRYHFMLKHFKKMEQLLSMEVVVQLNADAFLSWTSRRSIQKVLKMNKPMVLGSDMHNLTSRSTHMDLACNKIAKKYGEDLLASMNETAVQLLHTTALF